MMGERFLTYAARGVAIDTKFMEPAELKIGDAFPEVHLCRTQAYKSYRTEHPTAE